MSCALHRANYTFFTLRNLFSAAKLGFSGLLTGSASCRLQTTLDSNQSAGQWPLTVDSLNAIHIPQQRNMDMTRSRTSPALSVNDKVSNGNCQPAPDVPIRSQPVTGRAAAVII
jgi:hypothetical protein